MSRKRIIFRVVVFFSVMVLLRFLIITGIDYANKSMSNYIEPSEDVIVVSEPLKHKLNTVRESSFSEGEIREWSFNITEEGSFFIFFDNLLGDSTVSVDESEIMQNKDPKRDNYYPRKSYFAFRTDEYIENEAHVVLQGEKISQTTMYLIEKNYYSQIMEVRSFFQSLLFTILLIFTGISIFLWFQYKDKNRRSYFVFFALMGIVSIVKVINSGELGFLTGFISIGSGYDILTDNLTSILNSVWPFFIIACIFNINIPKNYLYIGFGIIGFMIFNEVFSIIDMKTAIITIVVMMLLNNILLLWGFVKEKEYSTFLLITSLIYSSFVLYYFQTLNGSRPSGSLDFFVNPAYLGALIYMGGFIFIILLNHFEYVRLIEEERFEIDRIHLLRGINHDLKLPLSIIKLNNEMIERYNLSREESIDCARTSLDASEELEAMMSNMSGYLSLKHKKTRGSTDVGSCFEKLDQYYSAYNQRNNFSFKCIKDEEDCTVPVQPMYFSRMLYNLVDNSFEHNAKGVNVVVRYFIGNDLKIEIEDDGMGMNREAVQKAYVPFYRGDESRTASGMGLGLIVVKNVVDKLKGSIDIESEVGRGTKVTIVIPV